MVTSLIEFATHGFVESEFAQLIDLMAAWRRDIDAEPFAHEELWATVDSPAFRAVVAREAGQGEPGWPPRSTDPR